VRALTIEQLHAFFSPHHYLQHEMLALTTLILSQCDGSRLDMPKRAAPPIV
jgi:hypothetical protein